MDARDTSEQAELRRSARQLASQLGPQNVADLDRHARSARLGLAVRDAGWLAMRDDGGQGAALAGGVEAAIVADALAAAAADVAFLGPVLGADLARRAGARPLEGAVAAFTADLLDVAVLHGAATSAPLHAVDCGSAHADMAYVLLPDAGGYRLAHVALRDHGGNDDHGSDLTRRVRAIAAPASVLPIADQQRLLTRDDLAAWAALGLALTSADLVGLMRGVLDLTIGYAAQRRQYGVSIGSFQAVQHLLAEARCLLEGASSIALHAAWAVDDLAPEDARQAGRVAKAYCARAARTVCETAVQVHGGIGNTWECMVHVFLRRALLSSQWFGDDGVQLRELQRTRLGVTDGLS